MQLYKRKGGEVLANMTALNSRQRENLSILTGGLVGAWIGGPLPGTDTSGFGIRAALFDAGGARAGSAFLVKTPTDADPTDDDDTLNGTADGDTIDGLGGNDLIHGLGGDDVLFGSEGDDRLEGDDGFDQLVGGIGSDLLYGGAGDDYLVDDDPEGDAGNDQFFGGDGWDGLSINRRGLSDPTHVLMDGGAGPDVLSYSDHNYQNDAILIGGDGDDQISTFQGHMLDISAGAGNDRVALNFLGATTTVSLGTGRDMLALFSYDGQPPVGGSITVSDFETGDLGDRLELINYLVSRLANWDPATNPFGTGYLRLVQAGADTRVEIDSDGAANGANFTLLLTLQNVIAANLNLYNLGGYAGDGTAPSATTILGTPGLDLLWGTGGADLIKGFESQDEVFGGAGDDRIEGGDGNDLLYPQYGNDVVYGEAGIDNLVDQEGGNDQFFGGDDGDYLVILRKDATPLSDVLLDGGAGDDHLDFNALHRTDSATLIGGEGNDNIRIAGNGNMVVNAGAGADYVEINYSNGHADLTLGAGADEIWVGADFGFGAGLTIVVNDFVAGETAGSDLLNISSYLGHWLLNWDGESNPFQTGHLRLQQSGADTLLAVDQDGPSDGAGFVTLITLRNLDAASLTTFNLGYAPVASSVPTSGDDTLNGTADADTIDGLGGNDVIHGLGDNDELEGGAGSDQLFGDGGNDQLDGGAGADELEGGTGNDIYIIDNGADVVRELLGEGSDTVYTTVSYALGAGAEVEILSTRQHSGTDAINLFGNAFAQTIIGNYGANTIGGGGGTDVLAGLAGDDTYIVDDSSDQVLENAGQGNDLVYTSASYVLGSNQEVETLSTQNHAGTEAFFLTGNQYNNILIGNNGNNIMNGNGGADMMYGLGGDDVYAIDNPGDVVIDGVDQGNDLVYTYLSHTLTNGNQIETLSTVFHTATDAINLGGNDFDNTLIGNYGANYINGNGGLDVMVGLNGDDTYVVENAADVVQEVAGGGSDLVYSFVSYVLGAGQQIEAVSTAGQAGIAAINLTGNEFGQIVVGNAGANILDGKSGNDTLYGLGGADTFAFTTALGAGNVDTIADFVAGTDKVALDDAIFTAIGGTLNANAFVIGTQAADADDRIIYNSATGALSYDADGVGGAAAVQFATLATGLALTAGDFMMI